MVSVCITKIMQTGQEVLVFHRTNDPAATEESARLLQRLNLYYHDSIKTSLGYAFDLSKLSEYQVKEIKLSAGLKPEQAIEIFPFQASNFEKFKCSKG